MSKPWKPAAKMALCLMLGGAVLFSGCSKGPKQPTYQELQAENADLKQQIADLQSQVNNAKAETTTADAQHAYPATSPQAFSDVGSDVPTADKINDLALLNIFDEASGSEFKPFAPITRGEYIVWLFKAYNAMHPSESQLRLSPAYKVPFTDLPSTHPSYKYVQALANAGFSVGYDDKTFRPDKPLTREEMIGIKYSTDSGEKPYSSTTLPFSDSDQVDKRFVDYIYSDYVISSETCSNIIRAFGRVKAFKPKEPVLRYEAAATLWQNDGGGYLTAAKALGRGKQ